MAIGFLELANCLNQYGIESVEDLDYCLKFGDVCKKFWIDDIDELSEKLYMGNTCREYDINDDELSAYLLILAKFQMSPCDLEEYFKTYHSLVYSLNTESPAEILKHLSAIGEALQHLGLVLKGETELAIEL